MCITPKSKKKTQMCKPNIGAGSVPVEHFFDMNSHPTSLHRKSTAHSFYKISILFIAKLNLLTLL